MQLNPKSRGGRLGLPEPTCSHALRATGITAYLSNGGSIENAEVVAAHKSPRMSKHYNRISGQIECILL